MVSLHTDLLNKRKGAVGSSALPLSLHICLALSNLQVESVLHFAKVLVH